MPEATPTVLEQYELKARRKSLASQPRVGYSDFHPALQAPYRFAYEIISTERNLALKNSVLARNDNASNKSALSVLDFACGTGEHSIGMALLGLDVVGVDLSLRAVALAQQWADLEGIKSQLNTIRGNARFWVKDLKDLDNEAYDIVFVSGALYYFTLEEIIPKLLAKLKPGGLFVCVETSGDQGLINGLRYLRHVVRSDRDQFSLRRLWRRQEIDAMSEYLSRTQVRFFGGFTQILRLFPAELVRKSPLRLLCQAAEWLDQRLFSLPFTGKLAFKFVLYGRKKP